MLLRRINNVICSGDGGGDGGGGDDGGDGEDDDGEVSRPLVAARYSRAEESEGYRLLLTP